MNIKNSIENAFSYTINHFGEDFVWGVSLIEPRKDSKELEDDSSPAKNNSGDILLDNYLEDLKAVKKLGITHCRLSLSWPLLYSGENGQINRHVVQSYHSVLDTCQALGIEPFVTLSNCDLPLKLEEAGGWANREILEWFAEYTSFCVGEFGGKVTNWLVLDKPSVFLGANCFLGDSKTKKKRLSVFLGEFYHMLLCQSIAFRKIKELKPLARVGNIHSVVQLEPLSLDKKDLLACKRVDAFLNRLFVEPNLGLGYPDDVLPFLKGIDKYARSEDFDTLSVTFDFVSLHILGRELVAHSSFVPYLNAKIIAKSKKNFIKPPNEVYLESLCQLVKKFDNYPGIGDIFIEDGRVFLKEKRKISDKEEKIETDFLKQIVQQLFQIKQSGGKISGYFIATIPHFSEETNFSCPVFGLIALDNDTQKPQIKKIGLWYQKFLSSPDNTTV